MDNPINWRDEYCISKDRVVLTADELQIPGVKVFANHKIQKAIIPLCPHYHENSFEFTLAVKGSIEFYTEKNEYSVNRGSVFITKPNEIHSTNNVPMSFCEQYWIQLDVSSCENLLFLNSYASKRLVKELKSINRHVIVPGDPTINTIIENAFRVASSHQNSALVAGYIMVFLQLLISSSTETKYHFAPDIEESVIYIKEHITEELPLEELAKICNLSTSQFKQKFRNVVGTSPRNYINRKKIEQAEKLLRDGMSVTRVSMELGFNSASYFSSVFKKYTLKSPREYKG